MKTAQSHAAKYAPELAAAISELCADVITKGVTGILEEVVRLHQEKQLLREVLQATYASNQLDIGTAHRVLYALEKTKELK